jgi:hypothetical protein
MGGLPYAAVEACAHILRSLLHVLGDGGVLLQLGLDLLTGYFHALQATAYGFLLAPLEELADAVKENTADLGSDNRLDLFGDFEHRIILARDG